jgi:hypothetical protein
MPLDDDPETPRGRGRPPVDDDARLACVSRHLKNDADLVARGLAKQSTVSEAVRRAILDLPGDGDILEDGRVNPAAVQRLMRKFSSLRRAFPIALAAYRAAGIGAKLISHPRYGYRVERPGKTVLDVPPRQANRPPIFDQDSAV